MNNKSSSLPFIDAARGIAILMVILVHTAQKIDGESLILSLISSYGQMGVQLFFLVSAYTLCHSWARRRHESYPLLSFFIRRVFRIAPLYYLGIFLYAIVSAVENQYKIGEFVVADQYTASNILINIIFLNGLFPQANNNIVPGGWSIGTEMLFYAVFPFLFMIYQRIKVSAHLLVLISILSFTASLLILYLFFLGTGYRVINNGFLYFNIASQISVFILGMSFWWMSRLGWDVQLVSWRNYFIGFMFFTAVSAVFWNSEIFNAFLYVVFFSGISFIFLVGLLASTSLGSAVWLQDIGKVSFSMYVIHFLFAHKFISLINEDFKLEEIINSDLLLVVSYIVVVCITFAIAKYTYNQIESKFIKIGSNLIRVINEKQQSAIR